MTTTHQVHVTDTNNRPRGVMTVDIDFDDVGPCLLTHDGQQYVFTHKSGVNSETGTAVREMATPTDARLWITLDATQIWED